jgi:hypothetical protein
MIKKKIIITPYLDAAMVEEIYKAMGMPVPGGNKKKIEAEDDIKEDF